MKIRRKDDHAAIENVDGRAGQEWWHSPGIDNGVSTVFYATHWEPVPELVPAEPELMNVTDQCDPHGNFLFLPIPTDLGLKADAFDVHFPRSYEWQKIENAYVIPVNVWSNVGSFNYPIKGSGYMPIRDQLEPYKQTVLQVWGPKS